MEYGQFCPVAKATEILGERWTLLIVRELLWGSTRYGELKRGLGTISPSVLSTRLKTLIAAGIIQQTEAAGGPEYHLTPAGRELLPIVEGLGVWGMRWARSRMNKNELDLDLLMTDIHRNLQSEAGEHGELVVQFHFTDPGAHKKRWWLVWRGSQTQLKGEAPERTPDLVVTCRVRALTRVWMGDLSYQEAFDDGSLALEGSPALQKELPSLLGTSPFALGSPALRSIAGDDPRSF